MAKSGRETTVLHFGPPLFGYAVALVLIALGGILRVEQIRVDFQAPFLLVYPSIALVSFMAGAGTGLAATAMAALFAGLFFPLAPGALSWVALAVFGPALAVGFARLRQMRERTRAAARELARFKFIGDRASDWILLLRESGQIDYANRRACQDLGWTERELAGRHIESLVPEPQKPHLRELLEKAQSGLAKPVEITFERRDKSPAPIELGCTAVHTKDDRVMYLAARDVGERKRIDRKLREVRHWESLEVMAGGLAHEFNNLLTSILGSASFAKEIIPADHRAARLLDDIVSAGERSAELVRLLLATSGYQLRYKEPVQFDRLLDRLLANRPPPPKVRVSTEADAAPFTCDRRSLETLLRSLIANAVEACGDEGGEVRVTIGHGAVPAGKAEAAEEAGFEEGDVDAGECVSIAVEDNGCGMGREILERAFDPFFTTKFTGRGLGLPAVRGIVRACKGRLRLNTAEGRGTRVEVWLPVEKNPGA